MQLSDSAAACSLSLSLLFPAPDNGRPTDRQTHACIYGDYSKATTLFSQLLWANVNDQARPYSQSNIPKVSATAQQARPYSLPLLLQVFGTSAALSSFLLHTVRKEAVSSPCLRARARADENWPYTTLAGSCLAFQVPRRRRRRRRLSLSGMKAPSQRTNLWNMGCLQRPRSSTTTTDWPHFTAGGRLSLSGSGRARAGGRAAQDDYFFHPSSSH